MKPRNGRRGAPNLWGRVIVLPDGTEAQLFRWQIGPALRRAGFRAIDLWADGPAFTAEDCAARGFSAQVECLRHKGTKPLDYPQAARLARLLTETARAQIAAGALKNGAAAKAHPKGAAGPAPRSIAALIDDFRADMERRVKAGALAPKSVEQYAVDLDKARKAFGPSRPAIVTKEAIRAYHAHILETQGPHAAIKAAGMVTRLFAWAEGRAAWRDLLPRSSEYRDLGLDKPEARLRVGLPAEMAALARAFDCPASIYAELETPRAERTLTPAPSLADGLIAMLWTAARVNDALSLREAAIEEDGGRGRGRLRYRQAKTGTIIDIPVMGGLKERLPGMIARARAMREEEARRSNAPMDYLIVNEEDGRPYWRERDNGIRTHKAYNARWNEYRALAAQLDGAASLIGEGVDRLGAPWLEFRPQDCRDTAVTRLALGGATMAEISAWHGSSVEEMVRIVRAYLAILPEHADAGGEKLAEWARRAGVRV